MGAKGRGASGSRGARARHKGALLALLGRLQGFPGVKAGRRRGPREPIGKIVIIYQLLILTPCEPSQGGQGDHLPQALRARGSPWQPGVVGELHTRPRRAAKRRASAGFLYFSAQGPGPARTRGGGAPPPCLRAVGARLLAVGQPTRRLLPGFHGMGIGPPNRSAANRAPGGGKGPPAAARYAPSAWPARSYARSACVAEMQQREARAGMQEACQEGPKELCARRMADGRGPTFAHSARNTFPYAPRAYLTPPPAAGA